MNTLCIAVFACVVVAARASGLWGHGYGHGHLPVVGASGVVSSGGAAGPAGVVTGNGAIGHNGEHNSIHGDGGVWAGVNGIWGHGDDGQWHGEGLLASQDWAGHNGGAIVAPLGVVGHGLGLGLGHGLGVGVGHGIGLGLGHYGHGHW